MKNFGEIARREDGLPHRTEALRTAANREFNQRYRQIAASLPSPWSARLQRIVGIGSRSSICWGHACHMETRNALSASMARRIARDFDPKRPLFFITLVHDGWRSVIGNAQIDIVEIRQRGRDCLKLLGFQGVAIIEIDALVRPRVDRTGDQLLPHIHAFGYLDPNTKKRRELLRKLRNGKRLVQFNGAKTVDCRELKTPDDVIHTVCYAMKLPLVVKRMVPQRGYPAHARMRSYPKRQQHALLSVIEVLSHCTQKDMVFTVGDCHRWLTDACDEIDPKRSSRRPWYERLKLKSLWREVHCNNRFSAGPVRSVRTRK